MDEKAEAELWQSWWA